MRNYTKINNWEENYKALGYKMKVYAAVAELTNILDVDDFFLFKGAALTLSVYDEENVLRIFGDIDIAIDSEGAYEKLKKSSIYDLNTNKFVIQKEILGIYVKLVFDVKYDETLEETLNIRDVFSRTSIVAVGDLWVRVPSIEDSFLLCIAHDIKHKEKKDPRPYVDLDIELLMKKIDKKNCYF